MIKPSSKRSEPLPVTKLIPNLITIGALCCGLTAIRFSLIEQWELSLTFLLLAAFLDGIDGGVARMLKATSEFGAQMDSLSDMVCFGVAPAIILHQWALQDIKRLGWAIALVFVICCALRLARFNTSLMEEEKESWQKRYLTGIPAPAGAILALLPLILAQVIDVRALLPIDLSWLLVGYLPIIALLMVSRVPTFTPKGKHISRRFALPAMLGAVILIISLIVQTWLTVAFAAGLYMLSLPFSAWKAKAYKTS